MSRILPARNFVDGNKAKKAVSALDESGIVRIQRCRNGYERGARIFVTIANDIANFLVCMIIDAEANEMIFFVYLVKC